MIRPARLRAKGVDPAMEAVALGHAEGRLISNFATPERDSILELLPVCIDRTHPDARRLARMVVEVYNVNSEQTDQIKDVVGFLDCLATDLGQARMDPLRDGIGSRALARALRPHLKTIRAADEIDATVMLAVRQVSKITDRVAAEQILSPALRRELGEKLWAVYEPLVADREVPS